MGDSAAGASREAALAGPRGIEMATPVSGAGAGIGPLSGRKGQRDHSIGADEGSAGAFASNPGNAAECMANDLLGYRLIERGSPVQAESGQEVLGVTILAISGPFDSHRYLQSIRTLA